MTKNLGEEMISTRGAITPKQEIFCQCVVKGMTLTNSYKEAFDTSHMKMGSITTAASALNRTPRIQNRIKELQKDMQRENMITVEKVLAELAHIAFDDIKNYMDFRTEKQVVTTDDFSQPVFDYTTVVDIKNSESIDTRAISEVSVDAKGNFKFKLYPKDAALVKLGQYLGLFVDRTELTGKDGGPIEVNEARQLLIERLTKKPHQDGD